MLERHFTFRSEKEEKNPSLEFFILFFPAIS